MDKEIYPQDIKNHSRMLTVKRREEVHDLLTKVAEESSEEKRRLHKLQEF